MTTTYIGPWLELQICVIQVQKSNTDRLTSGHSPEVFYFFKSNVYTKERKKTKEGKKILVGMPCSRRLEIVGTRPLTPFLVSFLIVYLTMSEKKKKLRQF